MDLLQQFVSLDSNVPIIILTGFATIQTAVESIKLGAYDYVQKPVNFQKLFNVIEHAIKLSDLKKENEEMKSKLVDATSKIITQNHTIEALFTENPSSGRKTPYLPFLPLLLDD